MSAAYEAEQAELKQSVESLSVIVEASEAQAVNVRRTQYSILLYSGPRVPGNAGDTGELPVVQREADGDHQDQ